MSDITSFIHEYGYAAVLVGGLFEGEAITLLAGFACRQHLLSLPWVMFWAQTGALISDQFCFYCGRLFGGKLLKRWPGLAGRVARLQDQLERHQTKLILTFQFIPGTCTVLPFALGMGTIGGWRFLWLDIVGSTVWAVTLSLLGWFFGAAAEPLLARMQGYALGAAAIVAVVLVGLAQRRLRKVIGDSEEVKTAP